LTKAEKLARCLGTARYRRALINHGVAAGVEHETVLDALVGTKTLIDIGANKGQFALVTRERLSTARIVSFEPLSRPAATYRAVFSSDPAVQLHQIAVGPRSQEVDINVSQRDDASSLLPITQTQESLFPGTGFASLERIRMAPLTDFASSIEEPAVLKLDVQGYELQTLIGCEKVLNSFRHIYAECSFVELYAGQAVAFQVIDWLRARGFTLSGLHNAVSDSAGRGVIQGDFLFVRNGG